MAGITKRFLAVLLLASSSWAVASTEQAKPQQEDVVVLNSGTFGDVIERQPIPALVKFMTADCKVCMDMVPTYRKVASNLKGIATVAAVDCGHHAAVRTCRSFGVYGKELPKILVFKAGTKVNPYTGGALKSFVQYTGKLSARPLIDAVTDQLDDSLITHLNNTKQHGKFLKQDPQLAKVLLFTDKNASTVLYKGLSWAYPRRLLFAEVRSSDQTAPLLEQYGVTQLPTLLVVQTDGHHVQYHDALKAVPLREFLDVYATSQPIPKGSGKGPKGQTAGMVHGEVPLHKLDATNLTEIDAQEAMWVLAFYKSQGDASCSKELNKYTSLLQEVQGIVNFGSVDTATAGVTPEQLKQYGINLDALEGNGCALQLVLLPFGTFKSNKEEFYQYKGPMDDAKAVQRWILDQVPDFTSFLSTPKEGDAFISATGADLPASMINSAEDRKAPVGKVVLFSTKKEVPGIYKALAMQYHGKSRLLFGWTTPDNKGPHFPLMEKMNVRAAPAMAILLPLPPKPVGDPSMTEAPVNRAEGDMAIQQYMGPLKFQKMSMWLQGMSALAGMSYKRHAGATEGPSHNDLDIRSQAQLQATCYDKPSLCLILMHDGTSDMANKHRHTIRKVAIALHGQPLTWVAVDVSRQHSFRRAFGFEAEQLPALVALSTRRMRFAQGIAPFSAENAKQLVTKVLAGSAVTLPLPALPHLVDGGEPDEEPPPLSEQEEFDLHEVMKEEMHAVLSKEQKLQRAEKEIAEEAKVKKAKKAVKATKKKSAKKSTKKKSTKKKPSPTKKKADVKDEL